MHEAGKGRVGPEETGEPAGCHGVRAGSLAGCDERARGCGRAGRAGGHGGAIVDISSVLGVVSTEAPRAAYSASKAGLLAMTRDLAMQWTLRRGIRVNALVPGLIVSNMTAGIRDNEEASASALSSIPMRRLGEADELVGALLLLASEAGSYITGSSLIIDGGWTAR